MKVIFLNAWNGRVRDDITAYINQQILDTDIFCFQEAYNEMQLLCGDLLKDYKELTASKFVTKADNFRQAIYIKRNISVISSGTILADQENCGLGLYAELQKGDKTMWICNFHGMSRPVDKHDTPGRLLQSERLIAFFKDKDFVVIGGDFNIFPENKSEQMFEKHGYRDLIKEFEIKTTRNQNAWDRYPNKQYYSDYVFTSHAIKLEGFEVVDNLVSDHLPMHVITGE
jgi:endonuclease/exonuclease/phosphatase family metal-dependent hydrolase